MWVHGKRDAGAGAVTEDAPRHPFGDYGTRKAAIEQLLLDATRRGDARAVVLHPGHLVGPGWNPLNPAGHFNPDVFTRIARGDVLVLPNEGKETVHHVHADDVAQAFELALASPDAAVGESFHVVSPAPMRLRDYAEAMYAHFGQMPGGQPGGGSALHPGIEPQHLADFLQTESQPLRRFDELHPRDIGARIAANPARRPMGLRHQPFALVKADRLDVHAGRPGQAPDRQGFFAGRHPA